MVWKAEEKSRIGNDRVIERVREDRVCGGKKSG